MRFGIVVFPGTNCDTDTLWVVREVLQHPAEPVWHEETDLRRFDAILLPGGFAHGDYLRAGAIARFSPVMGSVAEFAASLPPNYKLRGAKTKYILKRSIEELLPPFVTRRGKKGFGVPVAEWLKGKLRPLARDLLSPERVRRAGVFNPEYVTKLQDEHERGAANHRKLLWTLLMFELWHESFIETPRRIETSVASKQ